MFKKQSPIEKTLSTALSNENWGVSGTQMQEISDATKDATSYPLITTALWKTLKLPPKNWRQIFKALTVIEHLIKNGATQFIDDARDNVLYMKTLEEFSFKDGQLERGQGIREKSRQICELLDDDDRIRFERKKAKELRNKLASREQSVSSGPASETRVGGRDLHPAPIRRSGGYREEEDDYDERPKKKTAKKAAKKYDDDDDFDDDFDEKPKKKTAKKVVKKAAPVSRDSEEDEEEDDFDEKPKKKAAKKPVKKAAAAKKPVKKAAAKKSKKAEEEEEEEEDAFGFDSAPAAEPAGGFDDIFDVSAPAEAAPEPAPAAGGLDDVFGAAPAPMAAPAPAPMAAPAPVAEPPKKKGIYDDLFSLDNLAADEPAAPAAAPKPAKTNKPMTPNANAPQMGMGYGMQGQMGMGYGMQGQMGMGYGMQGQMGYGMNNMYRGY